MNKMAAVRWISVVVIGLAMGGCGQRSDRAANLAQAPAVPAPADTLKPPVPAAVTTAAASATTNAKAAVAATAKTKAKKTAEQKGEIPVLDAPLKVKRLVVAEDVERSKREPIGEKASFKAADIDKIYAFVEVENPSKGESEVFVTFEPDGMGASQGQVSLRVGASPRWRTWAFTRGAKKAGKWAAVVRGADGTVLARTPFEVVL